MKKLNISAIAPSGAGKTVYLASMYRNLSLQRPQLGFYLKTDHCTSISLSETYELVADPQRAWPAGTVGEGKEWVFEVTAPTPTAEFTPISLSYFDYQGGLLTDSRLGRELADDAARLRAADAILVLFDGHKILSLLRGKRDGFRYIDFHLTSTFEIVQQSRCPVHFVVTKWDLLAPHFEFGAVRDRLLEEDSFCTSVAARSKSSMAPMRLIPVSSVGSGFAVPGEEGRMRKTGARLEPFQVDIPVLSVLPDLLQTAFRELEARAAGIRKTSAGRNPDDAGPQTSPPQLSGSRRWLDKATSVAKDYGPMLREHMPKLERFARFAEPGAVQFLLRDPQMVTNILFHAIDLVADRRSSDQDGGDPDRDQLRAQWQQVTDEQSALRMVGAQLQELMTDFERRCPESVLAHGYLDLQDDARAQATARALVSAGCGQQDGE